MTSFEEGVMTGLLLGENESGSGVYDELIVTENGVYIPKDNIDAFNKVTVEVIPIITSLNVTENGTYTAESGGGYSPVNVNVPMINLQELNVTANGTYTAPKGIGYTPVNVNVPDNLDKIAELEQQIEELKNKVGYTFPEGTTMEQIKQLTASGASSEVTVSSTGDVCARVEFGYNETGGYPYTVTYGAWSKSEQRWLKSYGFRNPDPITFDKVEKENNSNVRFYFSDSGQYSGGGYYWNASYPANQYQDGWTYFDNTVQTYTVAN